MRTSKWLPFVCLSAALLILTNLATPVLAADAEKGQRIARSRCMPCHIVGPTQRQELSNSPPFDQIARRNDLTPETLAYLILSPHPRMNMSFSRKEADDLAAYIVSLPR